MRIRLQKLMVAGDRRIDLTGTLQRSQATQAPLQGICRPRLQREHFPELLDRIRSALDTPIALRQMERRRLLVGHGHAQCLFKIRNRLLRTRMPSVHQTCALVGQRVRCIDSHNLLVQRQGANRVVVGEQLVGNQQQRLHTFAAPLGRQLCHRIEISRAHQSRDQVAAHAA